MKISSIFLKNFLIMKRSGIELSGGLTTVTGETGSGKSLFVSAMKALKGERIGKNFLGRWGDTGEISAQIVLEECDGHVKSRLQDGGIDLEDGVPLILRRVFGEKNGSFINDSPVSVSFLGEIFSDHIEIGSQFENRELFKKDYRMKIVDSKADNLKKLAEYRAIYQKINEIRAEIAKLLKNDDPAKREYLEYQISELEKLATFEGEDEKLQSRMKFIENRAKIIKIGSELSEFIENSSKDLARCDTLASQLEKLMDIFELSGRISAVSIETEDISRSISAQLSKFDEDDENIEDVEKRFNLLSSLMIKHGVSSSAGLVEKMNRMSDELFEMDKVPQKMKELEKELRDLMKKGTEKALVLRAGREKAVRKMETEILKYLDKFGMNGVKFSVHVNYINELSEFGLDEVEFSVNTIGTDKMFDISSLSGGELSRLLLSIKLVDDEEGKILLFDEIDSSIGGETAKSAANEMKRNSKKNQIIVVTHFPQTAAVADSHILVEKSVSEGEISAEVKDLMQKERVKELARMMGDSDSSVFLRTAEKMIGG